MDRIARFGWLLALLVFMGCESEKEPETASSAEPVTVKPAEVTTARDETPDPTGAPDDSVAARPDASGTGQPDPDCQLDLGWDPWEPYQYLDVKGDVQGLDIEIFRTAAEMAGCSVTFTQGDWFHLLQLIRTGEVDALAGASKTSQREDFAIFSRPYREETFQLYVRLGDVTAYKDKSLADLMKGNFRLGLTQDYIYGDEVNALQDNKETAAKISYVPLGEMNFFNLMDNKIDGLIEDPFVGTYTLRRKGWEDDIMPLSLDLYSGEVYFMFSQSSVDEAVVERFNDAIKQMKDSGRHEELLEQYKN